MSHADGERGDKDGGLGASAMVIRNPNENGDDDDENEGNLTRLVDKLE